MSSSRPMVARPVRYGRRNNVKLIYSRACSRVGYIPYIPTGEVVLRPAHRETRASLHGMDGLGDPLPSGDGLCGSKLHAPCRLRNP